MVNSPPGVRRRLSVEDRRDELVDAGIRLIGTRDWDTVTMADLAVEAQTSKALLYHYFSDKPDLYRAAVRRAAGQLSEATQPDDSLPPPARLHAALMAHLDWIDEHHLAYRAVLHGRFSGDPAVQAIVDTSRDEVLERIVAGSGLPPVSPRLRVALRGWVGFLEGACLEWLTTKSVTKQQVADITAAMLPAAIRAGR